MLRIFAAGGSPFLRREALLTAAVLFTTIIATFFLGDHFLSALVHANDGGWWVTRTAIFAAVVFILIYGNAVYLVTRLGYFVRRFYHRSYPFEDIVASHWDAADSIAVLVPAYKEDARTIRQTMLSAALQHHPNKRVVLLLDDPQRPGDRESAILLAAARRVPREITALLGEPEELVEQALTRFTDNCAQGQIEIHAERRAVLRLYDDLIRWLDRCIADTPVTDHTDDHFVSITYREHQHLLHERARRLVVDLADSATVLDDIEREYRRLLAVFDVDVTVFERKRYRNVSLEANKAANLNTYIGLLGRTVQERRHADGWHIETVDAGDAGPDAIAIPDATFVLTLDADSMLRPDYALRLSSVFAEEGSERVAVVQTPYTAIPNAPGVLERIAGATTDMQYIVHQGFTWCDATFWVGANALLRKRALDDIRSDVEERGYMVSRFIQDHTVIEDTESTVDLAFQGWSLHNYPERLAFSATPPDFGSLLIQRTRWANGGLLIVPKLLRHALARRLDRLAVPSFLLRLHYLTSIATGSLGMLLLLLLPVDAELFSVWMVVLAVGYFSLYWRDLLQNGYRPGDMFRVAAFNLMLLPINVAGVAKSIQQGMTGRRTPFARTPKVEGRTAAPAWAVVTLWLLSIWTFISGIGHVLAERWVYATFSLTITCGLTYAVLVFVGLTASWEDATRGIRTYVGDFLARREATPSLEGRMRRRQAYSSLKGGPGLGAAARQPDGRAAN